MGYCVFAFFGVVGGAEPQAVGGVAHEVGVDGPFVGGHVAPDYRYVAAFDGVEEELAGEPQLGFVVLGYYQQAAGVFVDAVHQDAHTVVAVVVGGLGDAEVECEGVDQGAFVVAVAGVDHHAGGLVDDEQVVVFVDNVERDVLGDYLYSAPPVGHDEADDVSGADYVVGFDGLVPYLHEPFLDGALDAVARGAL